MSDQKAIIDRIRKLRALASRSTFENEAASCAAQAARLIAEHRIAEAQLLASEDEDPSGIVEAGLEGAERFDHWRAYLLEVLCQLHGCAHHWEKDKGRFSPRVYGKPDDIELVRITYAWLVLSVEKNAARAAKGKSDRFRRDYCVGVVFGLRDAIEQAAKQARKEAPTAALVVLDQRSKDAAKAVADALKGTTVPKEAKKAPRGLDEEAYERGEERGRTLHGHLPSKRKADLEGKSQ